MARCGCASLGEDLCNCALSAGDNVSLTGTGQPDDPWVVSAVLDPEAARTVLSGGPGVMYSAATGVIAADVSDSPGNTLAVDSNGLYAPESVIGMTVYATPGSFNWIKADYPNVRRLRVRVVGGGGGGASTGDTASSTGVARGGGGGGAYAESWIDADTLSASTTVTVGAGGAAGSPVGAATAGGKGGTSAFGSSVTAEGGDGSPSTPAAGSAPVVSAGGAGSAVATGQFTVAGEDGGTGVWNGTTVVTRRGGSGGAAGGGLGVGRPESLVLGTGLPGRNYGGGASGAVAENLSRNGGSAGGSGLVIVEMFI